MSVSADYCAWCKFVQKSSPKCPCQRRGRENGCKNCAWWCHFYSKTHFLTLFPAIPKCSTDADSRAIKAWKEKCEDRRDRYQTYIENTPPVFKSKEEAEARAKEVARTKRNAARASDSGTAAAPATNAAAARGGTASAFPQLRKGPSRITGAGSGLFVDSRVNCGDAICYFGALVEQTDELAKQIVPAMSWSHIQCYTGRVRVAGQFYDNAGAARDAASTASASAAAAYTPPADVISALESLLSKDHTFCCPCGAISGSDVDAETAAVLANDPHLTAKLRSVRPELHALSLSQGSHTPRALFEEMRAYAANEKSRLTRRWLKEAAQDANDSVVPTDDGGDDADAELVFDAYERLLDTWLGAARLGWSDFHAQWRRARSYRDSLSRCKRTNSTTFVDIADDGSMRLGLVAIRTIAAGNEVYVSYGVRYGGNEGFPLDIVGDGQVGDNPLSIRIDAAVHAVRYDPRATDGSSGHAHKFHMYDRTCSLTASSLSFTLLDELRQTIDENRAMLVDLDSAYAEACKTLGDVLTDCVGARLASVIDAQRFLMLQAASARWWVPYGLSSQTSNTSVRKLPKLPEFIVERLKVDLGSLLKDGLQFIRNHDEVPTGSALASNMGFAQNFGQGSGTVFSSRAMIDLDKVHNLVPSYRKDVVQECASTIRTGLTQLDFKNEPKVLLRWGVSMNRVAEDTSVTGQMFHLDAENADATFTGQRYAILHSLDPAKPLPLAVDLHRTQNTINGRRTANGNANDVVVLAGRSDTPRKLFALQFDAGTFVHAGVSTTVYRRAQEHWSRFTAAALPSSASESASAGGTESPDPPAAPEPASAGGTESPASAGGTESPASAGGTESPASAGGTESPDPPAALGDSDATAMEVDGEDPFQSLKQKMEGAVKEMRNLVDKQNTTVIKIDTELKELQTKEEGLDAEIHRLGEELHRLKRQRQQNHIEIEERKRRKKDADRRKTEIQSYLVQFNMIE